MGVDYLQCSGCDRGYRDDSEYCATCDCGSSFCHKECGALENYYSFDDLEKDDPKGEKPDYDQLYDDLENGYNAKDKTKPITCCICRKERSNHYVLFQALLQHYNITEADAFEIYKNQKD